MTLPPPRYDDGFGGGAQSQMRFAFPPLTPMVKRLLIINAAVYGLVLLTHFSGVRLLHGLLELVSLDPELWRAMFPFVPLWQLGTYGFVHDFNPGHILFNMLGLYFFGGMVERTVGGARFLVAYLAAVVIGGLAFLVVALIGGSAVPVVGASGGVLAIIVAAAVFNPNGLVIFILFPIPLKFLAGGIVLLDLINGALSWKSGYSDGSAHVVHLAGAAVGFFAVRTRLIWRDPVASWQRRRSIARETKQRQEEARVDGLLDKIHREGMTSLSKGEKEFLKRVSKRQ